MLTTEEKVVLKSSDDDDKKYKESEEKEGSENLSEGSENNKSLKIDLSELECPMYVTLIALLTLIALIALITLHLSLMIPRVSVTGISLMNIYIFILMITLW